MPQSPPRRSSGSSGDRLEGPPNKRARVQSEVKSEESNDSTEVLSEVTSESTTPALDIMAPNDYKDLKDF
jgi:hypothetical protein